jgi:tripeptide aminopeptidase
VTAATAKRATAAERERLLQDFIRLCEIESPSRRERAVADAVSAELRAMGLEVEEDGSAAETGSECGNLLARIPAPSTHPPDAGSRTILLCAHLDTVPLAAPVEVEREDGVLRNRNEAILGADNKAAVATILGVARRLAAEGAPLGVELLFTTCEELALRGAKAFERGHLRADYGFVLDHATPVGELIVAAPTYYRLEADFRGKAAHAGIRPEDGRNAIAAAARAVAAMPLGRVDPQSTANVGRIEGGSAGNVVAERCRMELEARSLDEARAAELAQQLVDAAAEAASDGGCDVETAVECQFRGYRLARTSPLVEVAAAALEGLGIEPSYVTTGGGSDANAFIAAGLPVLNVANGTEHNHEPDECVTVEALETMLDVTLGIVTASAG